MNDLQKLELALREASRQAPVISSSDQNWQNSLMRHIRQIGPLKKKTPDAGVNNLLLWKFAAGSFSIASVVYVLGTYYGWNIAGYLYASLFIDDLSLLLVR
jgi:hypothetical protein